MRSHRRFLHCVFAIGAFLAGSSCAGNGDELAALDRPVPLEPINCPAGTARVERTFKSAGTEAKIVGINQSCERPDGLLHGPTADWHVIEGDGSTRLERVHRGQYREGREVGVWHQWYANGEKKSERHYLPESELVVHLFWHANGRLRAVYQYWRYRRHGAEIYWEESGEISSVRVFDGGAVVYPSTPEQPDPLQHHSH